MQISTSYIIRYTLSSLGYVDMPRERSFHAHDTTLKLQQCKLLRDRKTDDVWDYGICEKDHLWSYGLM